MEWHTVTKFSQAVAIILFVGVFALGFFLGGEYQKSASVPVSTPLPTGGLAGDHCGGFIKDAPTCAAGFHCQLKISNPDTGGICVADPKELSVKLGGTISALGVSITPTSVLEDSRCPTDVQCIQAGTVRLSATIVSGMGTATQTFELNKAVTTEAEQITLVKVDPAPLSTEPRASRDYTFYFEITSR